MNRCEFIGRVGKQPEVRKFDNGQFISFSLAVSEKYTNKSTGEKIENTEWVNCTFSGKLSEVVEKYVNKGDLLFVAGKYKTRTYEKDGVKHLAVDFLCFELEMLGSKQQNQISDEHPKYETGLKQNNLSGLPSTELAYSNPKYGVEEDGQDSLPF